MKTKTGISSKGFTIIEQLVVVALSGVVMSGIYSAYYTQQKSYITQEQVAALQQNLRVAMFIIEKDIRMAGFDPTEGAGSGAGIVTANASDIRVTMDIHDGINNDGDSQTDEPDEIGNGNGAIDNVGEDKAVKLADSDGDGDNDLVGKDEILDPGNYHPLAENIDALNFIYFDESGTTLIPTATTIADIVSVEISIVGRTGKIINGYTNNTKYYNQQNDEIYAAPGDSYRRKMLTSRVKCRNLGVD